MMHWRGTGTALITPFTVQEIDYNAASRVIEHSISGEVDFLVPLGSTGEALTISADEQRKFLDHVIEVSAGRLPIVAGNFGGSDTRAQVKKIREYSFDSIDAILVSSPAYSKPTQEGIYQHYAQILDVSPVPVILYNVPSRTSSNVLPETFARLADNHEQLVAVKEAVGELTQVKELINSLPQRVSVLSGDDPTAMDTILLGGQGVISVISNALPRAMSSMINAAREGNRPLAKEYNDRLDPIHPYLYQEGNPAGIKAACAYLLQTPEDLRLPLVPISDDTRTPLLELLKTS